MSQTTFNGVSLFGAGTSAVFGGTTSQDVTVSIFTSATGESGSKVSINKSMLLSALTVTPATPSTSQAWSSGSTATKATFAATSISTAIALGDVSVGVYTQALQNLASLRAENGGSVSRLQFAQESAAQQRTNLEAAKGRIVDVDIATESTTLAKYNILVQASASMLAQANSTPNVALMLLN
jgi:flagellin